jgi:hypothetical protein
MFTSNDSAARVSLRGGSGQRAARRRISLASAAFAILVVAAGIGAGCGTRERASLHREVRLEMAHDPPDSAPAGEPLALGLDVTADPPLAPGSAHLWYDAGGGWVKAQLEPLAGTDQLAAEVPAQARGRRIRYYFTVQSPLGETMRLPLKRTGVAGSPATPTNDVYEILVRAPVPDWAVWIRGGGAVLALLFALAGGMRAARWRPAEPLGRPAGMVLQSIGVVAFAVALAGAAIASFQATGNPLRDVPAEWWAAGAAWLPILAVARSARRSPTGSAKRARRMALLAAILALTGAVALLLGLARLL